MTAQYREKDGEMMTLRILPYHGKISGFCALWMKKCTLFRTLYMECTLFCVLCMNLCTLFYALCMNLFAWIFVHDCGTFYTLIFSTLYIFKYLKVTILIINGLQCLQCLTNLMLNELQCLPNKFKFLSIEQDCKSSQPSIGWVEVLPSLPLTPFSLSPLHQGNILCCISELHIFLLCLPHWSQCPLGGWGFPWACGLLRILSRLVGLIIVNKGTISLEIFMDFFAASLVPPMCSSAGFCDLFIDLGVFLLLPPSCVLSFRRVFVCFFLLFSWSLIFYWILLHWYLIVSPVWNL